MKPITHPLHGLLVIRCERCRVRVCTCPTCERGDDFPTWCVRCVRAREEYFAQADAEQLQPR